MESNKQIDYDTLEWFDCKNNFPPISIDLYVDSEHGYGIGRLGKRVKDGSIIWTVHLDSGHVYLVYAFYKVKRWAYMPKDEKTNTKLKHELMLNKDRSWVPCYLKSEADWYIANMVAEHEAELDKWYTKLCRNRWRRAYAMFQYCCAMIRLECNTPASTMGPHQVWRYHTAYWSRWAKRWSQVCLEYKERIE